MDAEMQTLPSEVPQTMAASGCMYNYVVTAQKPTAVTHSIKANFMGPDVINLITAKSTRLEIFTVGVSSLQGAFDVPIYGRIAVLEAFRPENESKDLLFITTERYKFCVLEYDAKERSIKTRANGDIQDRVGRPTDNGQLGIVDPLCRMIALHIYDGMLKVIPVHNGQLQDAVNIRLEELFVLDMRFLAGEAAPTLAILYEDTKGARHVRVFEVAVDKKDLQEGPEPWVQSNLDPAANFIIALPAPVGGFLVVGEMCITYFNRRGHTRSVALPDIVIRAYGAVDRDGHRYLLSDHTGMLYLLVLSWDGMTVGGLVLQRLGRTSTASSLTYLDSGVVFVGSRTADSQLVKLHSEALETGPRFHVEMLEEFPNLGPIVDFAVVDVERQGQGQVVTCSGVFYDGSLRIVRNGIGINQVSSAEVSGIKGMWSLRHSWGEQHHQYLLLAFMAESQLLEMGDNDMDVSDKAPAFELGQQTLCACNTLHGHVVQITNQRIVVVDLRPDEPKFVNDWRPPQAEVVEVACANPTQVLVSTSGRKLGYFELTPEGIVVSANMQLESTVSCADVTPTGDDSTRTAVAAVGTWDNKLLLFRLPGLQQLASLSLGGDYIPRSVLAGSFEGVPYLLVGLGDGHLMTWKMDASSGQLHDKRNVLLGTKPIQLHTFSCNNINYAFAASDRPTVIYSNNKKLLYSNLNEAEVTCISTFHGANHPNSLVLGTDKSFQVGTIDAIQKLHMRKVPLGEQPRRLVHQPETRKFGVLTIALRRPGPAANGRAGAGSGEASTSAAAAATATTSNAAEPTEENFLQVLDDHTYDRQASFQLDPDEMGCALTSCSFTGDSKTYFVVGTAYVKEEEYEPTRGRILVLEYVSEGRLDLVCAKDTAGAVYSVVGFQGKLLAGVNSKIHLYQWDGVNGARQLTSLCGHQGHIVCLYIKTRGDFIVVGDLMKSVQLLRYKTDEGALELLAREYGSNWMTAVEILDDDTYVGAENSFNLMVVRKNTEATTDEERTKLQVTGQFHLGQFVNQIKHGSLVMRLPDSEYASMPTAIYCTIDGVLGIIISIPQQLYTFLDKLQGAMRQVIHGVGGLKHEEWRAFYNERRTEESRNFIDGDLVEQFSDLNEEEMQTVANLMGTGDAVRDIMRRVEELSRLH